MRRLAVLALAGAMVVPTMAAAQSPEPTPFTIQRDVCIGITTPEGALTPESLTAGVMDGSVVITAVGECDAVPRATAEPTLAPAADEPLPLVVGDSGFTRNDEYGYYAVLINNPNPSTWFANGLSVRIDFLDADGGLVTTTEDTVYVTPGRTTALVDQVSDIEGAKTMEVTINHDLNDWEELDYEPGFLEFSQVKTKKQEFGGLTTSGRITSHYESQLDDARVVAVYRNKAGKLLGGWYTYVDFVPGGGKSSFKIDSFADFKGVATTEVYQ